MTQMFRSATFPDRFRLQRQTHLLEVLDRVQCRLVSLPAVCSCACCGADCTDLVPARLVTHEFVCRVPIPLCYRCVKRPPFTLVGPSLRFPLAGLSLVLGCLYAYAGVSLVFWLACVTSVALLLLLRPERIQLAARQGLLNDLLGATDLLREVRQEYPELRCEVSLRRPQIARSEVAVAESLPQSLVLCSRQGILFSRTDLERSQVDELLLQLFIEQVAEKTALCLTGRGLNDDDHLQVNCVLLPGRRRVFQHLLSAEPRDRHRQLTARVQQLIADLEALPAVPVRWPLVFCCSCGGAARAAGLSEDWRYVFCDWSRSVDMSQEHSYSEAAMQVYGAVTAGQSEVPTADELLAWRALDLLSGDPAMQRELESRVFRRLTSEQRLEEAEGLHRELISRQPQDSGIRFRYALYLMDIGQLERSASVCQELLRESPETAEFRGLLGQLQFQMGQPLDARATIRGAAQSDRSAMYWLTAAQVSATLGEPDVALGELSAAILQQADLGIAYLLRARILFAQERCQRALMEIDQAEKYSGLSGETVHLRVRVLFRLQRLEQAIAMLSQLLQVDPNDAWLLTLRAEAYHLSGKLELARADVERLRQLHPNAEMPLALLAQICVDDDDAAGALAAAERATELGNDSPGMFLIRGISQLQLGNPQAAIELLEVAREKAPDDRQVAIELARALALAEESERALVVLDEILEHQEGDIFARVFRGFLLLEEEQSERAIEDFERVLRDAPSHVDACRGAAMVSEIRGDTERALELLNRALAVSPEDKSCRMVRARLLLGKQELSAAAEDLDSVLEDDPKQLWALLRRGHIQLNLGQMDAAQKDFDAILQQQPDFTPALIGRSVVFDQKGDVQRSQEDLESALSSAPERAEELEVSQLLMKAFAASQQEHFVEAIEAASAVLALQPDNTDARLARARASWYSEGFVEALQDFEFVLQQGDEQNLRALGGRGQIHAELGEYQLALQDLETAVELGRRQNDMALPYLLSGLGKALTGLGRFAEATAAFEESFALQPQNAWLQFNRGLLCLQQQDLQGASSCFEQALKLDKPRLSPRKRARAEAFLQRSDTGAV
ncbi:MAG TPA: hypothetical protein DCR20_02160 [Planctomycetaceae bacterium]|nr:hypothetical protein [Planctomycetaceae bacterium]